MHNALIGPGLKRAGKGVTHIWMSLGGNDYMSPGENMPEAGSDTPAQRMGAPVVDVLETCHPPLCKAVYRLPDAHIPDKFSDKTGDAAWVGRSDEVPGGHVLMPIKHDQGTNQPTDNCSSRAAPGSKKKIQNACLVSKN